MDRVVQHLFFFKQKTAYEMRISDWSSDVCSSDLVLSVFLWTLLVFSAIMMIAMPAIVWILARDYQAVPGKFELAVFLSRVTFPYLALISLVAMLSGLLNARSRFAPEIGRAPCRERVCQYV